MKRWVISDTHFYHPNIVKYCGRPADCDNQMIDNLSKLPREDVLYHLGDVHFGTEQQLKDILSVIKCRKYLIRGNHDHWTDTKYLICGFDGVFDSVGIGDVLLTHEPHLIEENIYRMNIHGHLHNLGYKGVQDFSGTYDRFNDGKHILYSPEIENYRPIHLQKLTAKYRGD